MVVTLSVLHTILNIQLLFKVKGGLFALCNN